MSQMISGIQKTIGVSILRKKTTGGNVHNSLGFDLISAVAASTPLERLAFLGKVK